MNRFQNIKNNLVAMSPAAKSSIALFLASIITKGISYLVTPIYTRIMPAEVFGQTSVFMTWLSIFGIIAMFCLANGIFNNGMSDYPQNRDEYSFSMLILSNLITIIFSIVILLIYPWLRNVIGIDKKYVVLMCIIFLFQPAYNFWAVRQRYEFKYKFLVIWTVLMALISPLCAVLGILVSKDNVLFFRIFGAELPLIIIYIGFYVYIGRQVNFKLNRKYWKDAIVFNLPLIPHYLSTYMLNSSDKLMIASLIGNSQTAYYSIAYSVAAVATIIWTAVNSSLIPYTYEKCKTKSYDAISKVTIPILGLFAIACFFVILLAPEVVMMMATSDYFEAIYVIPPIVGGVFFQVQYYMYANVVYFYKKPKYVMIASVTATVMNLLLNYIFIQKYGYLAAGYTTLACYMIQALIDFIAMKKVVGHSVYDMKYVLAMSVIVIIISLLSNVLYSSAVLRYFIAILVVIIVVIFRTKIKGLLTTIKKK